MKPWLSMLSHRKKISYFLDRIPKSDRILEIGCANGRVGDYLRGNGWTDYTGIDLTPPADIEGDIRRWRELGLKPQSFDTIIAFEVVEHVDCFRDCYELLRPNGILMVTTPVPRMDWILRTLEWLGLSQQRTSPHHCIDLSDISLFQKKDVRIVAGLAQWGLLMKADCSANGISVAQTSSDSEDPT